MEVADTLEAFNVRWLRWVQLLATLRATTTAALLKSLELPARPACFACFMCFRLFFSSGAAALERPQADSHQENGQESSGWTFPEQGRKDEEKQGAELVRDAIETRGIEGHRS